MMTFTVAWRGGGIGGLKQCLYEELRMREVGDGGRSAGVVSGTGSNMA